MIEIKISITSRMTEEEQKRVLNALAALLDLAALKYIFSTKEISEDEKRIDQR